MDIYDLVAALEKVAELPRRLGSVEEKLDQLVAATPVRQYVDIAWICKEIGCSRDWLRSRPWALPNFGHPDVGGRPRRFVRSSWEKWSEDLTARELAWKCMTNAQRQRVLKVSS